MWWKGREKREKVGRSWGGGEEWEESKKKERRNMGRRVRACGDRATCLLTDVLVQTRERHPLSHHSPTSLAARNTLCGKKKMSLPTDG